MGAVPGFYGETKQREIDDERNGKWFWFELTIVLLFGLVLQIFNFLIVPWVDGLKLFCGLVLIEFVSENFTPDFG